MIYVGIDVASNKHDICIMSSDGEIYGKKFQIAISKDEYKKLLSKIEEAKKLFKDGRVNFIAPADYRENSKIDLIIKDLIKKVALNNKIEEYSKS